MEKIGQMLSSTAKPTLRTGAILCKLIPHSEIKNKMSSTERHIRGALIEKKPRAMLIDDSQNAFPKAITKYVPGTEALSTAWKHLNSSPAPTDLPA